MGPSCNGLQLLVVGDGDCLEGGLARRRELGSLQIEFAPDCRDPMRWILGDRIAAIAIDGGGRTHAGEDCLALVRSHELSVRHSGLPAILIAQEYTSQLRALSLASGFIACVPRPATPDALGRALARARELLAQTGRHGRSEDHEDILEHFYRPFLGKGRGELADVVAGLHLALGSSCRELLRRICLAAFDHDGEVVGRDGALLEEIALRMGAVHLGRKARDLADSFRDGSDEEFERDAVIACAEIDRIGFSLGERIVDRDGDAPRGAESRLA